ncbi:hypothetical protein NF27_BK00150 [Candidatus Jidaibacter acanthamoeba]|uniref:Uncharacterized protein n=1 Tax=Candidatus Jidaibacter acanthamoebae TaxID=86105 RepID=A0A0C1QKS4_9RICK|nr:hypothetical protein NF27_BK00150 [Candidatus Jidaibacter acanthamoeba]
MSGKLYFYLERKRKNIIIHFNYVVKVEKILEGICGKNY